MLNETVSNEVYNFTFQFNNNYKIIKLEDIIRDVCQQWHGLTYDSNLIYLKIFLIWFLIMIVIDILKNPKLKEIILFTYKNFRLTIFENGYDLKYLVIKILIVLLLCKILYVVYITEFLINRLTLLMFIEKLANTNIL